MASIKENIKDGKTISFRYRCCVGRDDSGKQLFCSMTDTDIPTTPSGKVVAHDKLIEIMQRRADDWEKEIKKQVENERAEEKKAKIKAKQDADRKPFTTFLNEWVEEIAADTTRKATTVSFYKNMARIIAESNRFKGKTIAEIKVADINAFLNDMNADGRSESTVKHAYDVLKIVFNYAILNDYIVANPCLKVDKKKVAVTQKPVDALSEEDYNRFVNAINADCNTMWKLYFNLLIKTGLRRGEAIGLWWSDIDFDKKVIHIRRNVTYANGEIIIDKPKTARSERDLPLLETLIPMFKEWKAEQKNGQTLVTDDYYVFSNETNLFQPTFPSAPTKFLNRFVKEHNLPNVSPHDLRHTCASRMAARGANESMVSRMLGHSSTRTTDRYYIGLGVDDLRETAALMDDDAAVKMA